MRFVHVGFAPDLVDYEEAWALQRQVHAAVVAGEEPDTTLLLEHAAVYTAGKHTAPHERPWDGTPVIEVDRGGKITWHGPGQLVGYPIVRLAPPIDVVAHVRRLEEAMIRTCADFGVAAARVVGQSGAWVLADERGPNRKVGAIGIRVARQVTMHGFALNCDADLAWGQVIIPCGIVGAGVTSLSHELGRIVTVREVVPHMERHLADVHDAVAVRRTISPRLQEATT
ncbi:MAG: lipoyl(octanoyl) transferase LipB [Actinomycetes bacterium]|nr:lipoyl(octanoyl) transferase LipB [Actinomycetes bacterium]